MKKFTVITLLFRLSLHAAEQQAIDEQKQSLQNEFVEASQKNNIELVKKLIAFVNIDGENDWGMNALNRASGYTASLELVKLLLDHNASINQISTQNETALLVAAFCGQLKIVKYLVEHGADFTHKSDPNCKGGPLRTIEQVARDEGRQEIANYLASTQKSLSTFKLEV